MLLSLLFTDVVAQYAPAYQQADSGSPIALGAQAAELKIVELPISRAEVQNQLPTADTSAVASEHVSIATITLDPVVVSTPAPASQIPLVSLPGIPASVSIETVDLAVPTQTQAQTPYLDLGPAFEPDVVAEGTPTLSGLTVISDYFGPANEPTHSSVLDFVASDVPEIYAPAVDVVTAPPIYSMHQNELFDMLQDYAKDYDQKETPLVYAQEPAQQPLYEIWTAPLDTELLVDTSTSSAADPIYPIDYLDGAYLTFDWMKDKWSYTLSSATGIAVFSANSANRLTPAIVEWVYSFL